jgi:macrodomain Ter protein organizer (MatP/YcbG family)
MATATARNVDDNDYAILSQIAEKQGRSISEELRALIAERVKAHRAEKRVAELKALRDRINLSLPDGMTSLDLLREERDSW